MSLSKEIQAVLSDSKRWCVLGQDCMPLLASLPKAVFDHTITDPPYDEHTHANARAHGKGEDLSVAIEIDFDPILPQELAPKLLRPTKRWTLSFCTFEMVGGYSAAAGDAWVRTGIYRRTNGSPQFTGDRPAQAGEAIAIMHKPKVRKRWNGHGKQAYWESAVERGKNRHPTQKPLGLMRALIQDFTDPDDVIFDPFCGHGTTGVAALLTGRRFIGVESKPKYVKRSIERCAAAEQTWRDEQAMRGAFEAAMAEDLQSARDIFELAMDGE
jgi:site-specific DNA-methyltransferase (adenine-specific)